MSIEKLEFYKFNCLKCGKKISDTFFHHEEHTIKIKSYTLEKKIKSIEVPVCSNCREEMKAWTKRHKISKSHFLDVLSLYIFGIIVVIFGFIFVSYDVFQHVFFSILGLIIGIIGILGIIGGTYYIFRNRKHKNEITSPFRYIKFKGENTFIKPQGKGNWINYNEWLKEATIDDEE